MKQIYDRVNRWQKNFMVKVTASRSKVKEVNKHASAHLSLTDNVDRNFGDHRQGFLDTAGGT